MVEIHLEEIARVERLLRALKTGQSSTDEITRQVVAVPALARRLTHELRDRRTSGPYSVRRAISLLGLDRVRAHIKEMLDHWLNAVERPGGAQIIGDTQQTPIPRHESGRRRRSRLTA
ncbi:MAG: hypothetical protein ACE366_29060 [Bradymonadia bacterium]